MAQANAERTHPDTLGCNVYGRHPRAVLAGYRPIAYARHVRDYIRAVNGQGRWHDEVLVEEHADGTVTVLPSDAMPYPGRTIWRKTRRHRTQEGRKDGTP